MIRNIANGAVCATLVGAGSLHAQTADAPLVFTPAEGIHLDEGSALSDAELDALDGTEGEAAFSPCGGTALDYISVFGDRQGGEDWLLTFTSGVTTVSGVFLPVVEQIPTQPTRMVPREMGYDIYVGARQVPLEARWRTDLEVTFDLPDGVTVDGNVPQNDLVETLVGCPPSDLAALDTGIVERDGGTDRTILWPIADAQFLGVSISTVGPASSTMMFILER